MTNKLPRTNLSFPSPCPHCGKKNENKWCYEFPGENGDIYGVCKREADPAPGWEETPWEDSDGNKKYRLVRAEKPVRQKDMRYWHYYGRDEKPLVKVQRWDDGQGKKTFCQQRWDRESKQYKNGLKGVNRAEIPVYAYKRVRAAIAAGETIFIVEGETCCDALDRLGLVATTNLGGSLKWQQSDTKDLDGATVVLCPDRDKKGMEHMKRIAADFPNAQWLYPFPDSPLWRNIPESQGVDIADWISDGAKLEDLMAAVGRVPDMEPHRPTKPKSESVPRVPALPSLDRDAILGRIEAAIHAGEDGSKLATTISDLAANSSYQVRELWRLYSDRAAEIERDQTRDERKAEIQNLLEFGQARLALSDYLHPDLATPLTKLAELLNLDPAALLVTLLPTAASLLPLGNQLELVRASRFYAQPILYTGIVAESASMKTPAQKTILKPLFRLQHEAEDNFRSAQAEWLRLKAQDGKTEEPEPLPREYYTTDITSEAIATIQCNQPDRGFLIYRDELAGLLKDSNAYRAGKGSDTEKILSARDGTGIKINRASGKRSAVRQSGFSITGAIQPDVLRRQMGNLDDSNGYWARFLWARLGVAASPYPEEEVELNLDESLYHLYKRLASIEPTTFTLSQSAKNHYKRFYNFLDAQRMAEPRQGLRAVFGKFKGTTGELALLLHTINAAAVGYDIPPEVSEGTMQAAIRLAQYFLSQTKLLYAEEDVENGQTEPIYAHLIEISKQKGWLSARAAQRSSHSLRKLSPDAVRSHFREMEAMGFGSTKGEGKNLEWIFAQINKGNANSDKLPLTLAETPFEPATKPATTAVTATGGRDKSPAVVAKGVTQNSAVAAPENRAEDGDKSQVCHRSDTDLSPVVTGGGDKFSEPATPTQSEIQDSDPPFVTVVTAPLEKNKNEGGEEEDESEERTTPITPGFPRDLYEKPFPEFLRFGCASLQEVWDGVRERPAEHEDIAFIREECARMTARLGEEWGQKIFEEYHLGRRLEELSPQQLVEWFGKLAIEIREFDDVVGWTKDSIKKLEWTPERVARELRDRYGRETTIDELVAQEVIDWMDFLGDELERQPPAPALSHGFQVGDKIKYLGGDTGKFKACSAAHQKKKPPTISRIDGDRIEISSKAWVCNVMVVAAEEIEKL